MKAKQPRFRRRALLILAFFTLASGLAGLFFWQSPARQVRAWASVQADMTRRARVELSWPLDRQPPDLRKASEKAREEQRLIARQNVGRWYVPLLEWEISSTRRTWWSTAYQKASSFLPRLFAPPPSPLILKNNFVNYRRTLSSEAAATTNDIPFRRALQHPSPEVRAAAAIDLHTHPEMAARLQAELLDAFVSEPSESAQHACARALLRVEAFQPQVARQFELIDDWAPFPSLLLAECLRRAEPTNSAWVAKYVLAVRRLDRDPLGQAGAARMLSEVPHKPPELFALLQELSGSENEFVRRAATKALEQ